MAKNSTVKAYVLITVPASRSGEVVRRLEDDDFLEVKEAAAVYGESDVVAKVESESIGKLHELVMDRIQALPEVKVTRTFIIVPQLGFTR